MDRSSSCTSAKPMSQQIDAEARVRIRLFSNNPGIKRLAMYKATSIFSLNFICIVIFHRNILFMLLKGNGSIISICK